MKKVKVRIGKSFVDRLTEGKVYEVVKECRNYFYLVDDLGDEGGWDNYRFDVVEEAKPVPNGGSSDYYKLPASATELGDLIEHKNMNFNIGNIFKAAYRLGDKPGVDAEYDLNKIIWFANREINRIKKAN